MLKLNQVTKVFYFFTVMWVLVCLSFSFLASKFYAYSMIFCTILNAENAISGFMFCFFLTLFSFLMSIISVFFAVYMEEDKPHGDVESKNEDFQS